MPFDPSFRSRLRDALRQSAVGRPANAGADEADGQVHPEDAAPRRVELRYEAEEDRQHRVDLEQSAWIADALGGWWNREAHGVCLVVDRVYGADRQHGDAEIGRYAETLARCRDTLRTFGLAGPTVPEPTLFSDLENDDEGTCLRDRHDTTLPMSGTPADGSGPGTRDSSGTDRAADGDEDRFLFFDLETTGLTGGAGTCAFLIGYGWFERGDFRTRQYFLAGFGHEAAMLRMAAQPLGRPVTTDLVPRGTPGAEDAVERVADGREPGRHVTLASFNGKTFDVPLIVGRYLFHRLACPFDELPHVDLLHPARRLWRHRPGTQRVVDSARREAFARYFRATRAGGVRTPGEGRLRYDLSASAASCALGALEHAVLGFRRVDDVPGADIPTRYFHYVRTGDPRPLGAVLEHNRLDLVSLAAVASVVARMLEEGPQATRNAHECLALGRLYERSGAARRATACYERAVDGDNTATWCGDRVVEQEALRRLAIHHRRERRYEDAAAAWQRLLDLASARAAMDFEALHALAVHHEHRSKDLNRARALVVQALEALRDPRAGEALRHRLARIERKISGNSIR